MVSMIEHYSYCPRQCALIHIESVFDENLYTVRGHLVHERVDEPSSEMVDGVRIERALPIWCRRLGLTGRADVVEFHQGVPYPVEHKSGRKQKRIHEELQLCAQALCLEEMFGSPVPAGAVYYYASRKRREIPITEFHRSRTEEIIAEIRGMLVSQAVPPAQFDKRCPNCSLIDSCLPEIIEPPRKRVLLNLNRSLFICEEEEDE